MLHSIIVLLCALFSVGVDLVGALDAAQLPRQWAVRLRPVQNEWDVLVNEEFLHDVDQVSAIAKHLGFRVKERLEIGSQQGFFIFEEDYDEVQSRDENGKSHVVIREKRTLKEHEDTLAASPHIHWFERQTPRRRFKRNTDEPNFNDPLYPSEWYLNPKSLSTGPDFRVKELWSRGVNGTGVVIAVVDDGLQTNHPDLAESYIESASFDFNTGSKKIVVKTTEDNHGTRCAGQMVGKPNNNLCGVGVAFGANISALRLISESVRDADEAKALTYQYQVNQIYSNSWGPSDDGSSLDGPGYLTQAALSDGVNLGRKGLGSIYVFASGNGRNSLDNCNFDGYANSVYTITVGAITSRFSWPYYGERCSAQLAVAYSGGGGSPDISTTDIDLLCANPPCCTSAHSGTSAAAPFASSLIALMLSYRPNLSWRDMKYIIVNSAQMVAETDPDWTVNGAGYHVNEKFGFGVLNAAHMLNQTTYHERVPARGKYVAASSSASQTIGSGAKLEIHMNVTVPSGVSSEAIKLLEYVQIYVDIDHQKRSNLLITLLSPAGTKSLLAERRMNDKETSGYPKWTFMSARYWGEQPNGLWTLTIEDSGAGGFSGTIDEWKMTIYGLSCERKDWIPMNDTYKDGYKCPWELLQPSNQSSNFLYTIAPFLAVAGTALLGFIGYMIYRSRERIMTVVQAYIPRLQFAQIKDVDDQALEMGFAAKDSISRTNVIGKPTRSSPRHQEPTLNSPIEPMPSSPKSATLSRSSSSPSLLRSPQMRKDVAETTGSATSESPKGTPRLNRALLQPNLDLGQLPSPMPMDINNASRLSRLAVDVRQAPAIGGEPMLDSPDVKSPKSKAKRNNTRNK